MVGGSEVDLMAVPGTVLCFLHKYFLEQNSLAGTRGRPGRGEVLWGNVLFIQSLD